MPEMQQIHSNSYGNDTSNMGKQFVEWNRTAIALGIPSSNAALDCDRLVARKLGITTKEVTRERLNAIRSGG
jgi:hypothetical protein